MHRICCVFRISSVWTRAQLDAAYFGVDSMLRTRRNCMIANHLAFSEEWWAIAMYILWSMHFAVLNGASVNCTCQTIYCKYKKISSCKSFECIFFSVVKVRELISEVEGDYRSFVVLVYEPMCFLNGALHAEPCKFTQHHLFITYTSSVKFCIQRW